ncbi:MAG: biotin/lipoyl-containing protein, partial [Bradyrhizobium sp.]
MVDFRMPSLGADMEAGTLVEWLVKPGDQVKRGDVVAVVETQKGAIEIEVFEAGKIEQILVGLNTKVAVGTPLARIQTELEEPLGALTAAPQPAAPAIPLAAPSLARAPVAPPPPIAPVPATRARVSPAARQLAETRGIDLSAVTGSGPAGAITYADVERRLGEAVTAPEKKRAPWLDLDAMRTAIAAAMARSKREIPHYYLEHQVDVTVCEQWLTQKNATRPPDNRLLIGALAVKAAALAARRFPAFNGFY